MNNIRRDNEPPLATGEWGWKYHHLGIPTTELINLEKYLPLLKISVGGFDTSPFGIEWMRFNKDCIVNELIRKVPHIAFEVEDIESELKKHDFNLITLPNSPAEGIKVVMIEHNGAPIELIEFAKNR
ncbi:MAG: hypothetical protein WCR72_04215 [Bacteroidota bacterium]